MSTPALSILNEGITTGTSSVASHSVPEGADRFAGLLAKQIGRAGERGSTEDPAGSRYKTRTDVSARTTEGTEEGRVRSESGSRTENDSLRPADQGTARTPDAESGRETGPRLTGLDTWQLPLWAAQGAQGDPLLPLNPGAPVGLGDLMVTVKSRVAGTVAARFSERGGVQNLTLKLNPGHLGKVDVQLLAKGDHLSVRITATSSEAEAALRENIRDLTDAIQDRTGRFQQVDVKVDLRAQDRAAKEPGHRQDNTEDQNGQESRRDPGQRGRQNQEHPGTGAEEG